MIRIDDAQQDTVITAARLTLNTPQTRKLLSFHFARGNDITLSRKRERAGKREDAKFGSL